MSDDGAPRSVVEALIRVIRDLPAVGKDMKMAGESGGYAYRGIEAMTTAAAPLFGKHGVLVCPRVLESTTTPITKGNKPWVHREMRVEYVLRGLKDPEDYVTVGPFVAEADDNSDKSANKCMTQAYKQMLLQVLVISDRKDDPDDSNVSRDAPQAPETVGMDLAGPTYRKAVEEGYTAEQLDEVASDALGRAVTLPEVLRSEWSIVRGAWSDFKVSTASANPGPPLAGDAGSAPSAEAVTPQAPASNGERVDPEDPVADAVEVGSRAKKTKFSRSTSSNTEDGDVADAEQADLAGFSMHDYGDR